MLLTGSERDMLGDGRSRLTCLFLEAAANKEYKVTGNRASMSSNIRILE